MRTVPLPRLFRAFAALALLGACRDRASTDGTSGVDSAFARDIELAQQQAPPQTVFNDAPLGGSAAAASERSAPTPSPARAPRPTPTPRRESPRAPVTRTPRSTPPEPAPAEHAPEAPAAAAGVIGAGARVGMTMNDRTCTTALVGDKFTATVSSATVGSNGAVIPAGATVVLEVTSVERADPLEASRIHFHVRAIDVNGEPYPAEGEVAALSQMETERVSGGSDRTKVVGGAVAGAVLGRIFGGSTKATVIGAAAGAAAGTAAARRSQNTQACLAAGSSLQLTLSREIVMRRERKL
ncbi:MAG: glycine zipper 2TM domain-containing protein [Gemmatimonadaceae bacterium]